MAFIPYKRSPSGKTVTQYQDTLTGEVISSRRYRDLKTVTKGKETLYEKEKARARAKGYDSPYKARKAHKYIVEKFIGPGTIHHRFELGIPRNRRAAINDAIDRSPHFGHAMFVTLHVAIIDANGKEYERYISSTVYKKSKKLVRKMLEDVYKFGLSYGESYRILSIFIDFVDLL